MRTVIQRVKSASVAVKNETVGQIAGGLCVLAGIEPSDTLADLKWMMQKIIHLRIFEDENGKMNKSLSDTGGAVLLVSQFTLLADCVKGRRPSFTQAGNPEIAAGLFDTFVMLFRQQNIETQTGVFGADMMVHIDNDGPATFILQSPPKDKKDPIK